ncbi:MAG: hypothetical protein WB765_10540 [Acidimicrobiales bacterium]
MDGILDLAIKPMRLAAIALIAMTMGGVLLQAMPASASTPSIKSKVLQISDLPTGWSVDNSTSSDTTTAGCLSNLKEAPRGVPRVSESFQNGSSVPELGETLETRPGSSKRWNALNRALSQCKTISLQQEGKTVKGSVGAMSFPKVGDQSSAYAVTLPIEGINVGFDIILFRVGSYVAAITYADIGSPDVSTVQRFTIEAVNKIKGQSTTASTVA